MKTLQHMFADMTGAIEDLHAIAVEGQGHDVTADIYGALIACLREQLRRIDTQAADIENRLSGRAT